MSQELKPCPFCGSPAQEYVDAGGIRNYFCTKCPCALSGDYEHHMTGRKAWNTRTESANLAALREENARLRDVLRETVDQLSLAMAYMSDYLAEKEGMPETVKTARAALSTPAAERESVPEAAPKEPK